ncbi:MULTISPECIES: Co2+/Mg2+ efflux protein ApaG [Sphingobacterium]|uniref:Co2+/Mg2+ efflux protein ApaG n=1 Tax=Sphingobacterium cellulitidis TaxID=1768011 RepID=A0A8H9FYN8_9SPHI|nr:MULTISPECIES: Co2+/Mg2+ efflux protein ApaG [Sphingobacterium]MBA8985170.1 ApaG protein [Sphingobacterium soli]OYD40521.1 Co2+/Mg2+ efflux protein ApaG [Sphingobacterium cellulitidis]OYD45500.1 Co2+/Mg2+ efflux protein ApaG [Sphingobacterium cellulitidis]WFB63590.1 Co2+/Mg2+ efflux protein ApaG [Sphingobacterium sp. WM]GGE11749.1 Co2+/Mg2+ efflux protein ApaG [Sphingobacterium soli]
MTTQTTSGVKISVESTYQSEYSNPENEHFMFAYRITIENLSEYTVQLVRRHWNIYDSIGLTKQVDGDGVVGEQPVLAPGEMHQYVSGCNLKSDIGFMEGYYEMIREMDNSIFHVHIPRFNLIANYRMN